MSPDLSLALRLADAADAITMQFFQSTTLAVRTKIDMTPVSEADEAAEKKLRAMLAEERPGDGIVGEEFGVSGSGARRWILDPIDGTKNYVRGVPVWGTLIALQDGDRLLAGVVSAPALHRRWWASAGDGAFCNGRPIRVSGIAALSEAFIGYDSVTDFDKHGLADAFLKLVRDSGRTRGFGDFWAHMMVAEGALDVAVEPTVALWDMAAVQIIVEEAGGRFTDLAGNARPDGGSGISTNGLLHDVILGGLA